MIIISTDHASSGGGDTLDMPHKTAVPLFLVKPQIRIDEPFEISYAPITQEDFIPTVLNGMEIDRDIEGKSIFEWEENEERNRYYYTALYSDEEGEIEFREYKVVGDARKGES